MQAHFGELVAVDVPGLRDGDVLLGDAAGEQAADDGRGHVAAAAEPDFGVLEGGSHDWDMCESFGLLCEFCGVA